MSGGNDPYRGRDLAALIAPDRRVRNAVILVVTSMIAGGLMTVGAERIVDVCDQVEPEVRQPHHVEPDPVERDGMRRTRARAWLTPPISNGPYDPGAHM